MSAEALSKLICLLAVAGLLVLPACAETVVDDDDDDDSSPVGDDDDSGAVGDDDDSGAVGDDDTDTPGDDDTGTPGDDDTAAAQAPAGNVLCAAGGRVSSAEGITGVVCTSPVDLGSGHQAASADGSLVWQPGPITRIAP